MLRILQVLILFVLLGCNFEESKSTEKNALEAYYDKFHNCKLSNNYSNSKLFFGDHLNNLEQEEFLNMGASTSDVFSGETILMKGAYKIMIDSNEFLVFKYGRLIDGFVESLNFRVFNALGNLIEDQVLIQFDGHDANYLVNENLVIVQKYDAGKINESEYKITAKGIEKLSAVPDLIFLKKGGFNIGDRVRIFNNFDSKQFIGPPKEKRILVGDIVAAYGGKTDGRFFILRVIDKSFKGFKYLSIHDLFPFNANRIYGLRSVELIEFDNGIEQIFKPNEKPELLAKYVYIEYF